MSALFNTTRLQGKTVLITGASAGIGRASAVLFAKAGANLILLARRPEALAETRELALAAHKEGGSDRGGKIDMWECDVSKREEIDKWVGKDEFKSVDVLVNNAGLVKGVEKVGDIASEDIDVIFNTNVIGLIHLTQHVVRNFKARESGHVINLGSVAGREPYAGGSAYCMSKAALRSFSYSLLKELIEFPRIRVSEIQPGMVETDFSLVRFRGDADKAASVYKGLVPLTPEDIAEEIVWCALRPPHVNVAELFVFPTCQAGVGPGSIATRKE